jgi:hypothetical protein
MPPSKNVTVPVGVIVGDVTVAVNVTICPLAAGFSDDFSAVALVVSVTVWGSAGEVLFAVSESPLYVAVIDNDPAGNVLVVAVAIPAVLTAPDASHVVPFLKTTVPVGVKGAFDVTLAVNVTACP